MFTSEKGLDTIENPQKIHIIGDQGCLWLPPWKVVWVQCLNWVFQKTSYIFENYTFRGTQKNGAKKLRNKGYSIGKGNIILEHVHLRKGAGAFVSWSLSFILLGIKPVFPKDGPQSGSKSHDWPWSSIVWLLCGSSFVSTFFFGGGWTSIQKPFSFPLL